MPLSPGTALQNGHYVVDALLDESPNGDLYWGTHVPTGMAFYLQRTPAPENSAHALQRLQGLAFAPQPPLPNPFQVFVEGDGFYLVMGTGLGQPWCHQCQSIPPFAPREALALTRGVAEGALALLQQNLVIDLSPNRLWFNGENPIILTGIVPLPPYPPRLGAPFPLLIHPVQGLAALLYSLLLGKFLTTADTGELVQALKARQPTLSPLIVQAIQRAFEQSEPFSGLPSDSSRAIHQWLDRLPDALPTVPAPKATKTEITPGNKVPKSNVAPQVPAPHSQRPYLALACTAIAACFLGVGTGAAFRLNLTPLPGQVRLNPDQTFPPLSTWSGDTPAATRARYRLEADSAPDNQSVSDWNELSPVTGEEAWSFEEPWESPRQDLDNIPEEAPMPRAGEVVPGEAGLLEPRDEPDASPEDSPPPDVNAPPMKSSPARSTGSAIAPTPAPPAASNESTEN
jgi:hypothetical protein